MEIIWFDLLVQGLWMRLFRVMWSWISRRNCTISLATYSVMQNTFLISRWNFPWNNLYSCSVVLLPCMVLKRESIFIFSIAVFLVIGTQASPQGFFSTDYASAFTYWPLFECQVIQCSHCFGDPLLDHLHSFSLLNWGKFTPCSPDGHVSSGKI